MQGAPVSADLRLSIRADDFFAMPQVIRDLGNALVDTTALNIEARAKIEIQTGQKTGRIYELGETEVSFTTKDGREVSFTARRGKKSRQHQASAPGEAPATDTANLVNSIQSRHVAELTSEVDVGAEYGAPLELGSLDGTTAPRPFVGPAVEAERPAFESGVINIVKRAASG